jgi:eukaryotic-like serine/threonine-protein kinase
VSADDVPAQRKVAKELFGYRVRQVLGDGAWSRVYEVEDTKTHTAYALKHVVSEGEKQDRFVDQLRAEWRIGKNLHHPAIRKLVALKGEGLLNTVFRSKSRDVGLVMELVDAPPLSDMVKARDRPSMDECLKIFHDVASGLMHMHVKKFVHADMKPLNILYDKTRRITKIIDLGQSVGIGTQKIRLQGSAGYIAPEQAREVAERLFEAVTPATDVFNFGATMYAILMRGKLAPQSQHSSNKTLTLPAEELGTSSDLHTVDRSIPDPLSKLVAECLVREPLRRPTMAQAVVTLAKLLPQVATSA